MIASNGVKSMLGETSEVDVPSTLNASAVLLSLRLHNEIQPHEIPHHVRTQAIGVLLVDLPTKNPLLLHHQLFTLLSLICFPYQPCDVSVMPMPCYEIISRRIPPWKTYGYFVLAVRRKGDRPQIRQLEGREWRKRTAPSVTGTGSSAIVAAHTVAEKLILSVMTGKVIKTTMEAFDGGEGR